MANRRNFQDKSENILSTVHCARVLYGWRSTIRLRVYAEQDKGPLHYRAEGHSKLQCRWHHGSWCHCHGLRDGYDKRLQKRVSLRSVEWLSLSPGSECLPACVWEWVQSTYNEDENFRASVRALEAYPLSLLMMSSTDIWDTQPGYQFTRIWGAVQVLRRYLYRPYLGWRNVLYQLLELL